MRGRFVIFLAFFTVLVSAQVKWFGLSEALSLSEKSPRKILIDFVSDSCDTCAHLNQDLFNHPVIAAFINAHFYPVRFDIHAKEDMTAFGRKFHADKDKKLGAHEFTRYMSVTGTPSVIFLDENGSLITKLQGIFSPKEMEPYLSSIAANGYKKITSQQQWLLFQKKFKSQIK